MKKIISLVMTVVLLLSSFAIMPMALGQKNNNQMLKFNSDGKFKIIHMADIQDTPYTTPALLDYIKSVCITEKPDLIILGGDNIASACGEAATQFLAESQVKKAIKSFMSIFEELDIPVAGVFGNHDGERMVSEEFQMEYYRTFDNFLGYDDGDNLVGCGTYNLPVLSSNGSKYAYNLWFFDTHGGRKDSPELGRVVAQEQVDWYVKTSNELKEANGGNPLPSMAFQHHQVFEINDIINEKGTLISGSALEEPYTGEVPSTQLETMIQQGDVVALFSGHNHVNDFIYEYKGIHLGQSTSVGFNSSDDTRGFRVIELDEKDTSTYNTKTINIKETFCVDETSTARYLMNCSELGSEVQAENAFKYLFRSILDFRFFRAIKELFYIFM